MGSEPNREDAQSRHEEQDEDPSLLTTDTESKDTKEDNMQIFVRTLDGTALTNNPEYFTCEGSFKFQ